MTVKQILDRVSESTKTQNRGGPRPDWKPEWSIEAVFRWDGGGPALYDKDTFKRLTDAEQEGQLFCVVKISTHFPPRFETTVGVLYRGRISTQMGTKLNDVGGIEPSGAFTPYRAGLLLMAAQAHIDETLVDVLGKNEGRLRRMQQRKQDQELGPGGSQYGANAQPQARTGKTERDRAKKANRTAS